MVVLKKKSEFRIMKLIDVLLTDKQEKRLQELATKYKTSIEQLLQLIIRVAENDENFNGIERYYDGD